MPSDDAVVHLLDYRTGEKAVPIRFRRHPRPELFDGLLSERAVATAIVAASSRVTCYLAQTKSPWATTLAEHSARRTIAKAMGITRARATNESGRKAAEAFGGIGLRYAGAPQTTQQFEASENIRSTSLLAYGAHVAADAAATVCAGGATVTSDMTSQNAIVSLAASLDAARRATPSSEQEVKDQHGAEACANAEPLTEWTREASKEMVKLSNAAKAAEAARRMKLAAAGPAERRDDEQRIGLPPGALDEVRITLKMSERARREVGHQVQLSGANKDEWSFTLERRGFFFRPLAVFLDAVEVPASQARFTLDGARICGAQTPAMLGIGWSRDDGAPERAAGVLRELSRSVDGTQIDLTSRRRATTRAQRRRRAASRAGRRRRRPLSGARRRRATAACGGERGADAAARQARLLSVGLRPLGARCVHGGVVGQGSERSASSAARRGERRLGVGRTCLRIQFTVAHITHFSSIHSRPPSPS